MRAATRAHVLTFGTHREADLRASEVRSEWPDRLRFTLHAGGARIPVQTQLLGEHLLGLALAALGIAHTLGFRFRRRLSGLKGCRRWPGA